MQISELSAENLADLLSIPLDTAMAFKHVHEQLRIGISRSGTEFMKKDFEDRLSGISDEEVSSLLSRSVEEVEELRASGKLQQRHLFLGKSSPEDDMERLEVLRELLKGESEFRTRYPAAYEILFGPNASSSSLWLPSFDVMIPDLSWSTARASNHTLDADGFVDVGTITKSGQRSTEDSFDYTSIISLLDMDDLIGDAPLDRIFDHMSEGHTRGLLLSILGRDEYSERIDDELHSEQVRLKVGAPTLASIRLTDLRFALSISEMKSSEGREKYKRELERQFETLSLPLTHQHILEWKMSTLVSFQNVLNERVDRELKDLAKKLKRARSDLEVELDSKKEDPEERNKRLQRLEKRFAEDRRKVTNGHLEEEQANALRVSLSSAALALFFDLDLSNELTTPGLLANEIVDLADRLRIADKNLNSSSSKLYTQLCSRPANNPGDQRIRHFKALIEYRLGRRANKIAQDWFSLSPRRNQEWTTLEKHLEEGAKYEKQRYPEMKKIIESDDGEARALAVQAYELFNSFNPHSSSLPPTMQLARLLGVESTTKSGRIEIAAYVQLGSCISNGIAPYPTPGVFKDSHRKSTD